MQWYEWLIIAIALIVLMIIKVRSIQCWLKRYQKHERRCEKGEYDD